MSRWRIHPGIGALAGLLLAWLLPDLLGPPISAYAPELRGHPRLSDAVAGAGGMLTYWSQAPGFYLGMHFDRAPSSPAAINALGWALIGLTAGSFVAAVDQARRNRDRPSILAAGATGGLLLGWMVPSICLALSECFRHCWMHEGFLGYVALAGGFMLRAAAVPAELPWRLLAASSEAIVPVIAMPVSAAVWTLVGIVCAATVHQGLMIRVSPADVGPGRARPPDENGI